MIQAVVRPKEELEFLVTAKRWFYAGKAYPADLLCCTTVSVRIAHWARVAQKQIQALQAA